MSQVRNQDFKMEGGGEGLQVSPEPDPPDGWVPIPTGHTHHWTVNPPYEGQDMGKCHHVHGPRVPWPQPLFPGRKHGEVCLKIQEKKPGRRDSLETQMRYRESFKRRQEKKVVKRKEQEEARRMEHG